jgi:hypothetical protein
LQRKLELHINDSESADIGKKKKNAILVIFQFLETLPNLQVLVFDNLPSAYLSQFISSIRHTALLELALDTTRDLLKGPPMAGLAGLEKLSIRWYANDNTNEAGRSLAHLYELIRPTLTTLVELRIVIVSEGLGGFDLQILKPSADTLRTFEYSFQSADESILDTISTILPHLRKLSIRWDCNFTYSHGARTPTILWKACPIFFISRLILMSSCRMRTSKLSQKSKILLT